MQLFHSFNPWGQCWNCVHLSSLHTQQELTLAFISTVGRWVGLTETLRPLRWLLSSSVALSFPLPLSDSVQSNQFPLIYLFLLISRSAHSSFSYRFCIHFPIFLSFCPSLSPFSGLAHLASPVFLSEHHSSMCDKVDVRHEIHLLSYHSWWPKNTSEDWSLPGGCLQGQRIWRDLHIIAS